MLRIIHLLNDKKMTFATDLSVLKNQSLPGLVQEELERMILEGRLLPGDTNPEV